MQNNTAQNPKKPDTTDSLAGMEVAQFFLGAIFGGGVALAWEAGEMASAIYTDRFEAKKQTETKARTNGTFELGVKKSLGPIFSGLHQSLAEAEHEIFAPMLKPAAHIFSARSFG